ncbi:hypothetical protein ES705_45432 [subsurface metagenome]
MRYEFQFPAVIPQQVSGLDERIGILRRFIKNLMIEYYREGKLGQSFDRNINIIIYKIATIINNFDNTTLAEYIRGTSTKPDYRKLSGIFFRISLDSFIDKIIEQEIRMDPIRRPTLVLAGDIAYLMHNWNKSTSVKDNRPLSNIYTLLNLRTGKFRKVNLSQDIMLDEFLNCLDILVQQKLIDLTYKSDRSSLDDISWEISDDLKMINFYQSNSLLYLLDQQEIRELK